MSKHIGRSPIYTESQTRCFEGKRCHVSSVCLFVFQFDLVCVNAWMLDLTQAILNLGFLAGAFTLGYAADR